MKQFNYDLLENRKDQLEQDNSSEDRVYHSPNGTYPSITNLLYHMITKPGMKRGERKLEKKKQIRFLDELQGVVLRFME